MAVNADSLATWFREVLAVVAQWPGVALGLHVEDQAWSHDLLREGRVLGAVTSDPVAVQGCRVEPLGTLRYRPAAAPALVGPGEAARPDWSGLPMVVFNDKDALQDQWLARRGAAPPRVVHRVPTSADFVAAIEAGLGWGMVPEPQLVPALRAGALVALAGEEHLDVALHWQRWRLGSGGPRPAQRRRARRGAATAARLNHRECRRPLQRGTRVPLCKAPWVTRLRQIRTRPRRGPSATGRRPRRSPARC